MEYYSILDLDREPFSNSPDPRFFYHSRQHLDCLHKIELSTRLKRGLCIVLGEVGTGKSTLCREVIRRLHEDSNVSAHLILDPLFASDMMFLGAVSESVTGTPAGDADEWTLKERIKQHLFAEAVEQGRTVILIIDEGQKMRPSCLEYLREFLNYETNDHKLIQIVIFAQSEFAETVAGLPNFADRVNLTYTLTSLDFKDTRKMIHHRLHLAGHDGGAPTLFTLPAMWRIYRASRGFPRKIIHLCHHCMLAVIIQNKSRITAGTVDSVVRRNQGLAVHKNRWGWWALAASLVLVAGGAALAGHQWGSRGLPEPTTIARPHEAGAPSAPSRPLQDEEKTPSQPPLPGHQAESPLSTIKVPEAGTIQTEPPSPAPSFQDDTRPAPQDPDEDQFGGEPGEAVLPAVLGGVRVAQGDNLSRLMTWIYGSFSPAMLEQVMRVNPDFRNPNRVMSGQIVHFPAFAVPVEHGSQPRYWAQVAETDTLQSAVTMLRAYPNTAPPVHLVPFFSPQDGFRFRIVVSQAADAGNEAAVILGQIPPLRGQQRLIFDHWPPDAVFVVNPYQ